MRVVKTIFVVDDDPGVIYTVKNGLEGLDPEYKIVVAENGKKCLELLEGQIPDLILLDIMMPEMTGWETINKIKEVDAWKDIPVIFLTARTDRIAKNAGEFLADDFVDKPFQILELKKRVDKFLKK